MKDLENIKDELNEFAPELSRMKKQNGFGVPPRYFDRLGDDIIRQMKAEEAERQVVTKPWHSVVTDFLQSLFQPQFAMGLATVVLLLIGVQQFSSDTESLANESLTLEDLSDEVLQNYLADSSFDFEDDFILDQGEDYLLESEEEDEAFDKYFEELDDDLDLSTIEDLL